MQTHAGKCLCGAVQFSVTDAEMHHHACHCSMCRRWGSGPMFAAAVAKVTFTGEEDLQRYRSSDWAERGFCKHCGSHLFYFLAPANQYFMSVGAFDDAGAFALTREIYVDQKTGGYSFAGEHERWTEAETLAHFSGG